MDTLSTLNSFHRKPGVHPGVEPARERPDERISLIDEHARHTGG
jgi:hypothetical protein